jgi:hypothetical protein
MVILRERSDEVILPREGESEAIDRLKHPYVEHMTSRGTRRVRDTSEDRPSNQRRVYPTRLRERIERFHPQGRAGAMTGVNDPERMTETKRHPPIEG